MALIDRVIFFDMEGTILKKAVKSTHSIAPSAWTLIAQHLGPQALEEEEASKIKWTTGGYNGCYIEWMRDTIAIHKKYGLTRAVFEEIMNSAEYHAGVVETFAALRKRNIRTALITGGFKAQADRVQIELGIDHSYAACEYFWDGERLVHWNLLPGDYEGKKEFMNSIIREYVLTRKQQCAFVGDGPNDVRLAEIVGTSIAFNAAKELQDVATFSINQPPGQEDFRAILEHI